MNPVLLTIFSVAVLVGMLLICGLGIAAFLFYRAWGNSQSELVELRRLTVVANDMAQEHTRKADAAVSERDALATAIKQFAEKPVIVSMSDKQIQSLGDHLGEMLFSVKPVRIKELN